MRKTINVRAASVLAAAAVAAAAGVAFAATPSLAERLTAYFAGWYASVPGTHVSVSPTRDVTVPGFSAFRVKRVAETGSASPAREESSVTLHDPGRDEIFLGEVLHDPSRLAAGKAFDAGSDLPNIQASLQQAFGVPVRIERAGPARGALLPLTVRMRQAPDAFAAEPGFVSSDGATILLGEFRPLAEGAPAWREKLLSARTGLRLEKGRFLVSEFLDFQCERCRQRAPEVRRAVVETGGALDIHLLPIVQVHDWSFSAAECAAALAAVRLPLYARYEELVFARASGLTAAAVREIGGDVAEAAGATAAYQAELASGRARDHVLRDIELALRLGIHGTPTFVLDGLLVPGDRGVLENALFAAHGRPAARPPTPAPTPRAGGRP